MVGRISVHCQKILLPKDGCGDKLDARSESLHCSNLIFQSNLSLASTVKRRPRVMFLTHRLPYPPNRGDRIRAYHMLEYLSQYCDLYLGSVADEGWSQEDLGALKRICKEVHVERLGSPGRWVRAAVGFALGKSVTQGAFHSPGLARVVENWTREPLDAAVFYCTSMWPYSRYMKRPAARTIVDLVDVDSQKWTDYAAVAKFPKKLLYQTEAVRIARLERDAVSRADAVCVVSEDEAKLFSDLHPGRRAEAISNGVDHQYFSPDALEHSEVSKYRRGSPQLVFVGVLDYLPNVQGLQWFCAEVLPKLREAYPGLVLDVVGRRPAAEVMALQEKGGGGCVRVVGEVPDVRPYVLAADMAIAPLQIARGIQNKVLEALACSKPVIATEQAATGIDCRDGLLIARSVDDWMLWMRQLVDPENHALRSRGAREEILKKYSWSAKLNPFAELLKISVGAS